MKKTYIMPVINAYGVVNTSLLAGTVGIIDSGNNPIIPGEITEPDGIAAKDNMWDVEMDD